MSNTPKNSPPEQSKTTGTYGPYYNSNTPVPYYYGHQGGGEGPLESILGDLSPARLLRVARNRWLTLLLAMVFGVIAAYYFLSKKVPVYRATSTIEMTVRRPRIMNNEGAMANDGGGKSKNEEFNTRMEKFKGKQMRELAVAQFRQLPDAPELTDAEVSAALGKVSLNLLNDSRLVKITLVHTDPMMSAYGANAFAKAARQMAMDENQAVSEDAVTWLRAQATAQKKVVDAADQAIVAFRKANQLDTLENEAQSVQAAIGTLNGGLIDAKTQRDQAASILAAIKNNPLTTDTIGQLPSSVPRLDEIATATLQWAQAIQVCDALLLKYTDEHPRVKVQKDLIDSQLKQVKEAALRARETATSDLSMVEQQVKTLASRKNDLDTQLSELKLKITGIKAKLGSLERERDTANVAYQGILNRIEEARLAADEKTATIQIAEMASIPTAPVFLNKNRILAIGAMLGIAAGVGLALLKDILDDHIVAPLDVELGIGVDILGAIPRIKEKMSEKDMDLICLKQKSGHAAELFAGIRGVLDLPPLNEQSDSLVVTSTQPGEGKTFNAINLAVMSARSGRKTLLIDFDLRRPRLRYVFDVPEDHPSLLHALAKQDPELFPSLPLATECPNLDVVTTTADTAFSPAEVLGNRFVQQFAEWANENYERVIFDSPPLGLLADSIVLSGICKGVLLVCHPNKTKRSAMRHVVRRFQKVNGNIIGVIINNIDLGHSSFKKYEQYGYGYGYGYGKDR